MSLLKTAAASADDPDDAWEDAVRMVKGLLQQMETAARMDRPVQVALLRHFADRLRQAERVPRRPTAPRIVPR